MSKKKTAIQPGTLVYHKTAPQRLFIFLRKLGDGRCLYYDVFNNQVSSITIEGTFFDKSRDKDDALVWV